MTIAMAAAPPIQVAIHQAVAALKNKSLLSSNCASHR